MVSVWSGMAPGESTQEKGTPLATRPDEQPPATRIGAITLPQLAVYEPAAELKNGAAVVILPGGGYNYIVADKEGSEAAEWLNQFGVTAMVLHYRTQKPAGDGAKILEAAWRRPVQDAQRAIRKLRAESHTWGLDPKKIGILGFSAGGQAAAIVSTTFQEPSYVATDAVDAQSCRPDFSLLVYPAYLYDQTSSRLSELVPVTAETPTTFLVHAQNDNLSCLGSVYYFAALKHANVPAELHVFQTGGHGYGMRAVERSTIHTWPDRAADWLAQTGLIPPRPKAALVDGVGEGWRSLGEADFVNVNCDLDTWRWENGHAFCTGSPVGVIRSPQTLKNFELVCEWKHKQSGGNSGVFVWATQESIDRLAAGEGRLPVGIEVQVLDLGYADVYTATSGKPADWFTSHGDVFPTGSAQMKPFPPVAPNGQRSFPSKNLTKGIHQWNHYYVRAIDGEVRLWVNGEEVSGGTACTPSEGYLCLESEGAPVEFRNIRIRKLP